MVETFEKIAEKIGKESGFGAVQDFHLLSGGRNNRVAKIQFAEKSYLIKNYFFSVSDKRDRLNHEYSFVDFAWAGGCRRIAEPVYRSDLLRTALYEYIPGKIVNSRPTEKDDVTQATEFVLEVNARKELAPDGLPAASEAGFSVLEHLDVTKRRINRLLEIDGNAPIDIQVKHEIRNRIVPLWDKVVAGIHKFLKDHETVARPLLPSERWLSPSDFGFHNAIRRETGEIVFIDFEFAGWDDPVKLVCDFANQPDNILSDELSRPFMDKIFEAQSSNDAIIARHRLLLPVFQLKWVCIILNHFLPSGKDRHEFTLQENLEEKKTEQVKKMQKMLTRAENSAQLI